MDGSLGTFLLFGLALSVIISVGAAALVAVVLVRLPADYFCDPAPREFWADRHPLVRRMGRVLKNLLGGVLVAVGVVLSLPGVPGPGIVTILIGVMLLDFREKRALERWLISRPTILRTINRLRQRYGKPPLAWKPSTRRH